ncbi:MAG: helix-turn-helix domain-containing protein [Actinobacteria bacterium]|nr:helix-turn-helix domain-containing protein [Actinomycetota bacterium]
MEKQVEEETVDARVRRRLYELRSEQGLTLQQVADSSNIDVSTLSRLEAGKRRLALDHLPRLAASLGVTTDELIGCAPPQDPRVRERPRDFDGMRVWPLTLMGPANGPRAYKIEISPQRREPPKDLPVHEGRDWIFVIRGPLLLLLGEELFTIQAGEAVEFSTWTPHWFGAVDEPVELIMIVGPEGERIHLRR